MEDIMRSLMMRTTLAVVVCAACVSLVSADTLIYDNSSYTGSIFSPGYNYEIFDYGTSTGGLVSKIVIGYYNSSSATSWMHIKLYKNYSTTYYDIGYHIKTITISNLPATGGYVDFYEYELPEEDRFELPAGKIGYTVSVSTSSTSLALASGASGQQDELWEYYNGIYGWDWYPFWFGGVPWAGLYVQVYSAPPTAEATCDIYGYKFNDQNANAAWDAR